MKTINIDATELNAVRQFAAKDDIRCYLNGVLVQANATTTRLVTTDGNMLGLFNHDFGNEEVVFEEVIVPITALDMLKPSSKLGCVQLVISDGEYELRQFGIRVPFKPVEGKFPDFSRVIPDKVSGEAAHFNFDFLARIQKAQRMFSKTLHPLIWHGGEGSALVQLQNAGNFIGVLMPLRLNKRDEPAPTAPDTSLLRRALQPAKEASYLD